MSDDSDPYGGLLDLPKGQSGAVSGNAAPAPSDDPYGGLLDLPKSAKAPSPAAPPPAEDIPSDARPLTIKQYSGIDRPVRIGLSGLAKGAEAGVGFLGDLQQGVASLGQNPDVPAPIRGAANFLSNPNINWKDPFADPRIGASEADAKASPYTGPVSGSASVAPDRIQFPTSSDVEQLLGTKGSITNNPELAPQNNVEKYLAAGAEGLGSAVPMALTGGAGALAKAGLAGTAGGLAAQGASDAGGGKAAQLAAGVAAGLLSHGAVGIGSGMVERKALASQMDEAAANYQAAVDAHTSAKDQTNQYTSPQLLESKAALQSAKNSAEQVRSSVIAQAHAQAQSIGNATDAIVGKVADAHGSAPTLYSAGEAMQNSARDWIANVLPAKQKALWDPINSTASASGATSDLANFTSALDSMNAKGGELAQVAGQLKSSLPAKLQKSLGTPIDPENPPTYSWSDVKNLRTTLGDAMSNPKVISDIGAQNLKQMYGALTADMEASLQGKTNASGGSLADDFRAANAESTRLYDLAEGPVSRIVGSKNASLKNDSDPHSVAESFLSKNSARDLSALRGEMPEAVNQLASAHLRTNPNDWLKLTPETKAALVPGTNARAVLDQSLAAKARAPEDAKLVEQHANDSLTSATKSAKAIHEGIKFKLASNAERAKQAAEEAKAKMEQIKSIAESKSPQNPLLAGIARGAKTYTRAQLAGEAGGEIAQSLGIPFGRLGGMALGVGAPMVASGVRTLLGSPKAVATGLRGAIGANALGATPPPPLTIHKGQ